MIDKGMYLGGQRKKRARFYPGTVIFTTLLLVVVFFALFGFIQMLNDKMSAGTPLPAALGPDNSRTAAAEAAREPDALDLSGVPEELQELLEKNPETYDFVSGYSAAHERSADIDISGDLKDGGIPLFLQWDKRWGYEEYGSSMLAITGCGPTCMAMVVAGLLGDEKQNPLAVAEFCEENGYYAWGEGTSWELMEDGARKLGLSSRELSSHAPTVLAALRSGAPVICAVRSGDFTTTGHYIVLAGENADGTTKVNDPNSIIRSETGWPLETILDQANNLWAFALDDGQWSGGDTSDDSPGRPRSLPPM
jgi:hypothetical protein